MKRGWIRVAADSILRLTRVLAARYELRLSRLSTAGYRLRLIHCYGWLGFRRLNKSCDWFYSAAGSSSGGWIRVAADSVPQLTWVPAAGYKLQLTPSYGWLEFRRLDTTYRWFHPAADSSSGGSIRAATDFILRLTRVFISSKFKDLFCKIYHFYGLFSTDWLQLPLIQALTATSRTLKKLQEASRSFKTLAATDSNCSSWFKQRRLIWDLGPIDYLQNFDPDAPW